MHGGVGGTGGARPTLALASDVTFTRHDDGRSVTIPTTGWFTISGRQIARSEVHLSDTAAVLDLLS